MKIEIQPDETIIDTWSINYIPPVGEKAIGKLSITNQRLVFLPQHGADSLSLSIYNKNGLINLNRTEIKSVNVQKSFFSKKVLITMADNSTHVFDYGVMNIDKLAAAIQSNLLIQKN
jgi:hypothetical protein